MDQQDLGGFERDDGDGGGVGDGQDPGAAVGVADAEVVHAAGPAEADFSSGVDAVVAQAVVLDESVVACWTGFG